MAAVCNPIFINTFVVFIRLYWFEKRFQNVVREARNLRRTRTRSRTKSEAKQDRDLDREEKGVGNRKIVVLRGANGHAQGRPILDSMDDIEGKDVEPRPERETENKPDQSENVPKDEKESQTPSASASTNGAEAGGANADDTEDEAPVSPVASNPPFHRDIMFADEVGPSARVPQRRDTEHHIAFVENQRNPKDKGTLRIPGPRDFDRGLMPQRLEEGDEALNRQISLDGAGDGMSPTQARAPEVPTELNSDDHPIKRNITIDEPDHPRSRGRLASAFTFRRNKDNDDSTVMSLRQRARSRTFGSIATARSQERDPMPYLSWTPTIGRNSMFVDLTEEQREELGGIEYRALKTLAFILICKSTGHMKCSVLIKTVYYVGFFLFGLICFLPWITTSKHYSNIVREDGVSPVWW